MYVIVRFHGLTELIIIWDIVLVLPFSIKPFIFLEFFMLAMTAEAFPEKRLPRSLAVEKGNL